MDLNNKSQTIRAPILELKLANADINEPNDKL